MSQYQPTVTDAFEPAYAREIGPVWDDPARADRLPVPVAARIVAASSLALWVLLWKLVAAVVG